MKQLTAFLEVRMTLPVDALAALQLAAREVERSEREGAAAWRLRASREYPTGIADLWDALTSRERIPRWFLPVSGDLRPGGRYSFERNASGEILRCEPPHRLGITWEYGGQVSWVDVRLSEVGDEQTLLVLEHEAHVPPEMWDQFGPGAVGVGWDQAMLGLAAHLAGGAPLDPEAAAAWQLSEEGKRFAAASSDAWAAASIAAGTDEAAAREAAARTTAFYTGEG